MVRHTPKQLSKRLASWKDTLAEYNFTISYKPGRKNEVANAPSRKQEINIIELNLIVDKKLFR